MAENTYLISLQGVEVSYPKNGNRREGRNVILNNIRLNIRAGEFLTLVGPTGCGKSTLLRLILGAQCPTRGKVLVDSQPVTRVTRDCGIVFQKYSLFPHLKVLENIAFGPMLERTTMLQRVLHTPAYRSIRKQYLEEAREYLERIGLNPGDGDKYPYELSGGMQQRVAIARALAMDPKIMLFDEPTSALDAEMIREVLDVMRDLAREGMTMLVITHEVGFAREASNRVVFMDEGRIIEDAPTAGFFEAPREERARQFLSKVIKH